MRGYTLIELLLTVAILGILASIGVPVYRDYMDTANINLVQSNLRAIYLQEREYFVDNGIYYATGATCNQSLSAINTTLFSGTQLLTADEGFNYCILQTAASNFQARAEEIGGTRTFTIDQNNVDNF